MSQRLEGKVAIVTGAGSGLGREIARLYAEEGAAVVACDIRDAQETVDLITEDGGQGRFVAADVTKPDEVRALVEQAESLFGKLDIMIANAGTLGRGHRKSFLDIAEEEAREVMEVNFWGVFHSFRMGAPAIVRAGGGAMIAVSSTSAVRGMSGVAAYSASKGAVSAFMRSVAAELAPQGVRVNSLIAGPMATLLHRHLSEDRGEDPSAAPVTAPDRERGISDPREVAQVALFLASDAASFVVGEEYRADGGRSMLTRAMGDVQQ